VYSLTLPIVVLISPIAPTASWVAPWIAADLRADLLGRLGGLGGEFLHLRRDDGKALAGLAGARRFDGRVQRQEVGLLGDVGDELHHLADRWPPGPGLPILALVLSALVTAPPTISVALDT
jgi:hypothetical protein